MQFDDIMFPSYDIQPAVAGSPFRSVMGIADASRRIAVGTLSREDLVRDCLARIEANPRLNIFIHVDAQGAIDAARAADRGAGLQGPLSGIPLVVKDNIHVAGMPASAGTPALAGFKPTSDAPTVAALRRAGAVVLGKTNMHELAFGATGYNHAFHHADCVGVRNPYDALRIAGGSSAGSAAALAARMALGALGTDTGGSMRIPCALNGCASLRPSWGRYPGRGVIPIANSRDTVGPMGICMADVALLDTVITGDSMLHPVQFSRLRLGMVASFWNNLDADTRTVTQAAVARLEVAGVTLVEIPDARLQELNEAIGFPVVFHEAYDDMVAYLREQGPGIDIETLYEQIASPDVKGIYRDFVLPRRTFGPDGELIDVGPLYEHAVQRGRPALREHYRELFQRHCLDAFVFPTTPIVAPLARAEVNLPENFHLLIQNTEPAASAGLASIQLPIGLGPESGLPVGLELDGPVHSDRRLLSIGLALEALFGRVPSAM